MEKKIKDLLVTLLYIFADHKLEEDVKADLGLFFKRLNDYTNDAESDDELVEFLFEYEDKLIDVLEEYVKMYY